MSKRIWELDALRGVCILGMVLVHFLYDLDMAGVLRTPAPILFFQQWGGIVFLLISGICVTLGSRHLRRGLTVLGCGMLCTAVTAILYFWGMFGKDMLIYFGILHCLGVCMLLWEPLSRLPRWALAVLSGLLIGAGLFLLPYITADIPILLPLGLCPPGFSTGDYYPLLPNLGFFLLGALLGRTVYKDGRTRLPGVDPKRALISFLCACGRHSLWVYLLHQPVLMILLSLLTL